MSAVPDQKSNWLTGLQRLMGTYPLKGAINPGAVRSIIQNIAMVSQVAATTKERRNRCSGRTEAVRWSHSANPTKTSGHQPHGGSDPARQIPARMATNHHWGFRSCNCGRVIGTRQVCPLPPLLNWRDQFLRKIWDRWILRTAGRSR